MKSKAKSSSTNQGCLGRIFFDVPVYRLSQNEYESQQKAFLQRNVWTGNPCTDALYRNNPDHKERMECHLKEIYGGCWRFNEIIGFVRLYFFFTQVRGEYWRIAAKRISRTRRKVFRFLDPKVTFEEHIPTGSSNAQIFAMILKYLQRAQNQRNLKNRYIDKSVFEYIGHHVDWNTLVKLACQGKPDNLPS